MELGLIGVAIAIPCFLLALADRKKIIAARREEFAEETRNLILAQAQKQDTELEPCPFCGRNMKYNEMRWAFVWEVHIDHDYDTRKLYVPCPMHFYKAIPWKDRSSGEAFNEDWVKRRKLQFIESWNRRQTNE